MIRVEAVGFRDGEPSCFARRPMPGADTDVDSALFCPVHSLSEEQAQILYEQLGGDHVEWVEEHFPSVARQMGTEDTFGFLFIEAFEDHYAEYEVALEIVGSGEEMEASLEIAEYRWTPNEEEVTIPYRYKVCENLISGIWFNYMIDRHDLDREPFELTTAE